MADFVDVEFVPAKVNAEIDLASEKGVSLGGLIRLEINNLPVGKYTLYEVKAPNGYEKTDKVYNFEIKNKGNEIKIDVPNIEIKTDKVIIIYNKLIHKNVQTSYEETSNVNSFSLQ